MENDRSGLVEAGRAIETESFRIIDEEIGGRFAFSPDEWQVVRRVVHTTGDTAYAEHVELHPDAIASGVEAFRRGAPIFADTRMIGVGLSPWRLRWFGTETTVPSALPESQEWAERLGVTRSVAAFRHFGHKLDGSVVAIGNAPTALLEVIRMVKEEGVRPALIVGAPVGFVSAAESKEALRELANQPFITVRGRKGGSSVAVSIVHALLELAKAKTKQ